MDQTTVKCWRFVNATGLNPNLVWEEWYDSERREVWLRRKTDLGYSEVLPTWIDNVPYLSGNKGTACNADGNTLVMKQTGTKTTPAPEKSGGSVDYYQVHILNPTTRGREQYTAECNDIIEALGMTYAEGNAFKALWRSCAARTLGKLKEGGDSVYDAEKVVFFGVRVLQQRKANATT